MEIFVRFSFLLFGLCVLNNLQAQDEFITIWNTNNPGDSEDDQIIFDSEGFFYDIYWEEVSNPSNNGSLVGDFDFTIITFPHAGIYRVKVTPGFGVFDRVTIDNSGDHLKLIDIEQWGTIEWGSLFSAFAACSNLTTLSATDIPDLSNVLHMGSMFSHCRQLSHIPNLNQWDLSNVISIESMFTQDTLFNQDISNWDVSGVGDMPYLFAGATAFNQDISSWNVSNVQAMFGMFAGARAFNQDISGWNVSNVEYMSEMFFGAWAFNQDISNWNVSKVTTMGDMFWDAFAFNQDIGDWDVSSVIDMRSMFASATSFNQDIGDWDVSNVTDMNHMFAGATSFSHDISDWNTEKVTDMNSMFVGAESFNIDISSWNVSRVVNMSEMFLACPIFNHDLSAWDVSNVNNLAGMFHEATAFNHPLGAWQLRPGVSLTNMLDDSGLDCVNYSKTLLGWAGNPGTPDDLTLGADDVQYGTDAVISHNALLSKGWTITDEGEDNTCPFMRDPCVTIWQTNLPGVSNNNQVRIPAIGNGFTIEWENVNNPLSLGSLTGSGTTTITLPSIGTYRISITPGAGTFGGMVFNNGGDRLKLLTLDQWGTSEWTVAANAFFGCENLKVTAVDIPDFNGATSMHGMFRSCASLTTVPNMNAWDVGAITDMGGMFAHAEQFQQNLSLWDVSNVTAMDSMFHGAISFNGDITGWEVSAVTDMSYMFSNAESFDQEISDWITVSVTDMKYMFNNAFAFNKEIGDWNLSSLNSANNPLQNMLSFSGMECHAYSFTLLGWAANPLTPNNLVLGAADLMYSPQATGAKNDLLTNHNWTITDAGTDANCELYSDKFITVWRTNNVGVSGNNQILIPATGTNYSIYWEQVSNTAVNGTATGNGATTITFPASGVYRVKISPGSGTFHRMNFAATGDGLKLLRIENWGTISWSNLSNAYNGCTNLTVTATDTIVLSSTTNMNAMFQNCISLTTVPSMNTWNTTTITNTSLMFYGATNFNQSIGSWNTGNVLNMSLMFYGAVAFNQPIGSWNTIKVTNMSEMFHGASAFNQPIGTWNTGAVTNMSMMFADAFSFNQSLNGWNVSKVTNMSEMFLNAISFNGNISSWNTILVTTLSSMFSNAIVFNQPIGSWNTGNVTSMFGTFNGATSFNQPIGNWNTIKVTSMFVMFQDAHAFNQPIGNWNTANVTSMSSMFRNAFAFNQNIGSWNVGKVTSMSSMFNNALSFNQDIDAWNVRKVTSMTGMFINAESFNHDIGSWTFASTVALFNMLTNSGMDCNQYSLTLIGWAANDTIPLNRNLGALDLHYLLSASAARNFLISMKGWTITDAGQVTVCPFSAPRVYVDQNAPGMKSGVSWYNAFTNLQDALEVVDTYPGLREIWIADGTYYPADADRDSSFVLFDSVSIYGGFLGVETVKEERTSDASLVKLSGDIGVVNTTTDNSYHVIRGDISCDDCVLDRVTIRNGNANGVGLQSVGAAILNAGVLSVSVCIIEQNVGLNGGTPVYNTGMSAELIIEGVLIRN